MRTKLTIVLLLAASLLMGLAQVLVLPPWEGFDETAHYSYIDQLAGTRTWPRIGDPLAAQVEAYASDAPTPYAPTPPFDRNGHWTYHAFFSAPAEIVERGRDVVHAARPAGMPWQPGKAVDWQAQHPPLYYLALAPLFRLSATWSLLYQLMLLRSASHLSAGLGLCIATFTMAEGVRRLLPKDGNEGCCNPWRSPPRCGPWSFPAGSPPWLASETTVW